MNPETRFLKQATYTPIDPMLVPEVERPKLALKRPLLKPGLIALALGSPETARAVLKRLRDSHPPSSLTQAPLLLSAAEAVLKGDHLAAASHLADVAWADVTRFAEDALNIQKFLVQDAERSLSSAIDSAFTRASQVLKKIEEPPAEPPNWRSAVDATITNAKFASPAGELRRLSYTGLETTENDAPALADPGSIAGSRAASSKPFVTLSFAQIMAELSHKDRGVFNILRGLRTLTPADTEESSQQTWHQYFTEFVQNRLERIERVQELVRGFVQLFKVEPLGYLHLERLQFTPVGYRRGDLIYSVPLMPGEVIRLSHREWSKTETDLSKLVATSIETAAQDTLSEKSELTESFKTQQQRESAFNASTTVSDGTGSVHISASASYGAKNSEAQSRESTARRTREVTRLASSRAKSEHKVTFRVSTQYEVEEQSYREIKNESDVAIRWDFHRLMREWRVELYRYDIRLTYDLVIPEPGSYLMRKHILLKKIEELLAQPNPFRLSPAHINEVNYEGFAQQYRVTLEPPPPLHCFAAAYDQQTYSGDRTVGIAFVELALPPGYGLETASAVGSTIKGGESGKPSKLAARLDPRLTENLSRVYGGARGAGQYLWRYEYDWSEDLEPPKGAVLAIYVWARGRRTDQSLREWQNRCYERLVEAAKAQYDERRERLSRMREALQAELGRLDGLALRKVEREELMKSVLRWLLGPGFSFYPSDLPPLQLSATGDLEYFDPETEGVTQASYQAMLQHGDVVRFLHQAIEWENLNYVLYPYFWTDNSRWDFKQALYHDDYEHRSFLKAGAARVVLTIRPDYVDAFLAFQETLRLDPNVEHPYTSVGEELKQIAQTVYHYTPGTNEELPANLVDTWTEFTPTGALDVVEGRTLGDNDA